MEIAEVNKQYALVTGGSSGIGLAIAHQLAKRKFNLVLVSNQPALLEQHANEITNQYKVICRCYDIDLTQGNAAQQVFEFCRNENIMVDVLVNNAGMLVFSEAVAADPEKIHNIIQLHVEVPTLLCRFFGEEMKKRKSGYILNVSSISSVMPYPGISIYGPTKTYMRYFTRALRNELKMFGINVACAIPGATATALYDQNKIDVPLAKKLGIMHTPEFVAVQAVNALFKNKSICTTGVLNKVVMKLMPLIPSSFIMFIHRKTNWIDKGRDALS